MTAAADKNDAVAADKAGKPPVVTVVLTPGRSGSSLLMEVLGNLGAGLSDEMIPGRLENPHGFFEDARVVEIHKGLMSDLGARPGFPMPEGWLDQQVTRKAKRALTDLMRKQADAGPTGWAIKDPRISELLPLWLQVFNSAAVSPRFILALRDPAAVAASLRRSINRDERLTELQWLYRTTQALYHSAADCYVLHYEHWFERPGELAQGLAAYCGLGDIPEKQAQQAVKGALEERLDRSGWQDYEVSHPLVRELYAALRDCRGTQFERSELLAKVRETARLIDGFRAWGSSGRNKETELALRKAERSAEDLRAQVSKLEGQAGVHKETELALRKAEKSNDALRAKLTELEQQVQDANGQTRRATSDQEELVRESHRLLQALHDCEQRNEALRTRLAARKTPAPQPPPQARSHGNKQSQPRPAPAPQPQPQARSHGNKQPHPAPVRRQTGGDPRQSVRYRLGDVLVKAVSRPGRDTLAAPVRLWRLLREGLHNRRARRARRRAAG